MYLAQSISWQGKTRPMVGVIRGDILMHAKPVGRGYVIIEPTQTHPWRRQECRPASADFAQPLHAHEFHYSEIRGLPPDTRYAYTVKRGYGVDGKHDGIIQHNLLASYTHLRGTAGCDWPAQFIQFARHCSTLTREIAPCLP